ncbi:dTDP-4-dehydrorhamnose 3,5-epimerase [Patescibacteria group bacterium]|nr:dTDP-4-dehydrorhamnose 3,5-epimerase [Patescibacteria group bacterium]MBU1953011.1 dTDP-4-dehydrorhamnose 3,5-epimerase [Patescibacteria group bacterium]
MIFTETPIPGLFIIDLEKREDERGFFARFYCENQFKNHGLEGKIVQINNSLTKERHTLRGMHYQLPPAAEIRVARCLKGATYDMSLDLRSGSLTFGKSFGIELTAENRRMMYIPKGFAHGFMTMEKDTEFLYLVSEFYTLDKERIIRWNDPKFDLKWPYEPKHISEKDSKQTDFDPAWHLQGMDTVSL